ncbi:hypothetical protein ACI4BF_28935, partial [Klebsiella pneumoniae]|uniref:hypothetical protein n=1 Tax=Klebsiella pneumoniae TaxID=573 RepID=UPI0038529959
AVLFNQGSGTASVSVPSCTFTRRAQVVSGSFTLEIWESTGRHMHASDNTVTVVGPTSSGPLIVYAMEFSGINTFDVTG